MTTWWKMLTVAGLTLVVLIAVSVLLAKGARAQSGDAAYAECVVYYVAGVDKVKNLDKKAVATPEGWTVVGGAGFDSSRKRGHGVLLCR